MRKRKKKEPLTLNMFGIQIPTSILRIVDKEETIWDYNEIQMVDFFDFWPDPRGTDIDSCRYVFQREWVTKPELQAKLALWKAAGTGTVTDPDWEELKGTSDPNEGRYDRMSAVGFGPTGTESSDENSQCMNCSITGPMTSTGS